MQVVLLPLSLSLPFLLSFCSFFAGPARLLRERKRQAGVRSSIAAVLSPLRATCNLLPCSLARSLTHSFLSSFPARVPGWSGRLVARPGMRYPRCHGPIRTYASGQSVIHNANARGFCPRLALGDQSEQEEERERERETADVQPHSRISHPVGIEPDLVNVSAPCKTRVSSPRDLNR